MKEALYKAKHDAPDANLWQTCEFYEHREHSGVIFKSIRHWLLLENQK